MIQRTHYFQRQADILTFGVLVAALVVGALSAHLVWNMGWLPGVCLIIGMTLVWAGVCVFRDRLIRPLQAMVEQIQAMQQASQWKKLPLAADGELKAVAAGFNELVDHVAIQQRSLSEQIGELQLVNAELDQLANVKDDFLQTINHQLRTPMTAIIEGIRLLKDKGMGPLNSEQQTYADLVENNAVRLNAMLEDMLDLSLLKSGRRPLHRRVDEITAPLQRMCKQWQGQFPETPIELKTGLLPAIYFDVQAIEDVLNHLLRNATRHAPEKTGIEIATTVFNEMVEVSVRSQGPVLSPDQIRCLFEPFVHLHTPDAPGSQGSGLGLAFCRQVVERHGGSIRVESEKSAGTTVTMSLPLASAQFLFVDACRMAQEEAAMEGGTYGLCFVVSPAGEARVLREAEALLRKNTHRGDRFVGIDDKSLVIVAVTDDVGLAMMIRRLRAVVQKQRLSIAMAGAVYPLDGDRPERLLMVARNRLANPITEDKRREG